jgi:hypothetical protein
MASNTTMQNLKKLSRKSDKSFGLASFDDEITDGTSDRAIVIVLATMVETYLEAILAQRMDHLKSDDIERLFEGYGVLSSFSSKITIGYAFNIFNNDVRRDLNYIKDIRNAFAHSRTTIKFTTPEVSAACALLSYDHPYEGKPKSVKMSTPRKKYEYYTRQICLFFASEGRNYALKQKRKAEYQLKKLIKESKKEGINVRELIEEARKEKI